MDDAEAELALSPASLPPSLAPLSLFFLPIGMLPHFLVPSRRQQGWRCRIPKDVVSCGTHTSWVRRSYMALPGGGSSAAPSVLPDSPPTVHAALKGSPLVPPQASPTPRTHRLLSSSREGSATLSLRLFQESAPLCLRRLVSLTFLLVTMQMMIINSRICSGNNTRYSVIYHLEVSWLWGGYCISSCTRQVRCRH